LAFSAAGFAHGDLAPENLRIDEGTVFIDGLGRAVVASSEDQRLFDLAQVVVLSALLVGSEAAAQVACCLPVPRRAGPRRSLPAARCSGSLAAKLRRRPPPQHRRTASPDRGPGWCRGAPNGRTAAGIPAQSDSSRVVRGGGLFLDQHPGRCGPQAAGRRPGGGVDSGPDGVAGMSSVQ
jgi:hypothetical protein